MSNDSLYASAIRETVREPVQETTPVVIETPAEAPVVDEKVDEAPEVGDSTDTPLPSDLF